MKFQPDLISGANVISGYTPDSVTINQLRWQRSLVLPSQGDVIDWPVARFEDLRPEHFEALAIGAPELVIFGSGPRLRFVAPECLRPLLERRIGVETMDTAAACRTYNILVAEGRRVVAGLLLPSGLAGHPLGG